MWHIHKMTSKGKQKFQPHCKIISNNPGIRWPQHSRNLQQTRTDELIHYGMKQSSWINIPTDPKNKPLLKLEKRQNKTQTFVSPPNTQNSQRGSMMKFCWQTRTGHINTKLFSRNYWNTLQQLQMKQWKYNKINFNLVIVPMYITNHWCKFVN